MAKIKITPLRSFFDGGKGFFVGKKYSMDEEQAAAYIREGWAAEWSAESDGTAQTDGDDGDITDDLTDGQGDVEGSDGTGAGGV
ncbi:MAG: hypothetical protein ACFNT6_01840 [Neisseria sp.]|uniref:hypothetical protein n=1 Tax=Neisseria sp. TaxID=192066 RepID=UPI003621A319